MSYHILKKTVNLCFPLKEKYQIKIKNHKNRKECYEHCKIFHCIALLRTKPAFTAFRDLHASTSRTSCSYWAMNAFPNLIFKFRIRDPLIESTSCFFTRLSTLVLVPIGLLQRTQSPRIYLSTKTIKVFFAFQRQH